MVGALDLQATFEHRLDQLGQQATVPGQAQPAGIDLVHHAVEQPGLEHLVDRPPRRGRLLDGRHTQRMLPLPIFSHGHLRTPINSVLILYTDDLTPPVLVRPRGRPQVHHRTRPHLSQLTQASTRRNVCPHFRALRQTRDALTRHNIGRTPLMCPSTAERG